MLHKNKADIILVVMVLFVLYGWVLSSAQADNLVIDFFQDYISAVDGNRCPMTPSCSSYARQSIDKHGPIVGWIMACDRLVRCGHDEMQLSPALQIQGYLHAYDPVEANDFWWFDREKKE